MTPASAQHDGGLPYFFLDVDGVLNAYAYDPLLAGYGDFKVHEAVVGQETGFRTVFEVWLSVNMGKSLAALPAEIVWLTTWERDADRVIAPLAGLPRGLRVLSSPSQGRWDDPNWKFEALRRTVLANPHPFVWADDDIDTFGTESIPPRRWAEELSVPSLLIAPDPRAGLLPGQIEAIEDFLSAHA